jgi:hypothetical protein
MFYAQKCYLLVLDVGENCGPVTRTEALAVGYIDEAHPLVTMAHGDVDLLIRRSAQD